MRQINERKKHWPTAKGRRYRIVGRRLEGTLPPPTSGKVLTAYLDKIAAKLTPEDLQDLDRAINASHESSH